MNEKNFKIGDTVKYEDEIYEITSFMELDGSKLALLEGQSLNPFYVCISNLEKVKSEHKPKVKAQTDLQKRFIENKRRSIIEEIKANKDFASCFEDIEKEVKEWSNEIILNYKLNGK